MLVAPVILVATQPDLGTSILIAAGGVVVAWLAGVELNFLCSRGSYDCFIASCNLFFKTISEI